MSLARPSLRISCASILCLATLPVFAATLQESISSRQAELERLLGSAKACEGANGYLKSMGAVTPQEQALLDAENADRTSLHRAISKHLNIEPEKTGEERASRYVDRLRPGILREVVDASGQLRTWDGRDPDPRKASAALRIVTLDGASLHSEPDADSVSVEDDIPRFSAYTVMKEQDGWYQVTTRSPDRVVSTGESPLGWISGEMCFPWNHSIVVEPTPLIGRDPALIFEDNRILKNIAAMAQPEARKDQMSKLGETLAGVVAEEPVVDYGTQKRAFVLPVISYERTMVDGRPLRLLELGAPTGGQSAPPPSEGPPLDVVFVMDTSGSMGPYTQEVIKGIKSLAARLSKDAQEVNFGFIGYRDDPEKAKGQEALMDYMTEDFTREGLEPLEQFTKTISKVKAVEKALGDDIEEAMYNAAEEAVHGNWKTSSKDGVRMVVVIGDAPGHETIKGVNPSINLRQTVAAKNINVATIFLKNGSSSTPESDRKGLAQFTELSRSNDGDPRPGFGKPMMEVIDAQKIGDFSGAFERLLQGLGKFSEGWTPLTEEELASSDTPTFDLMLNNAYLNWTRERNTGEPPAFVRGWTTDYLLQDPAHPATTAKVMLTKDQLGNLVLIAQKTIEFQDQGKSGADFFEAIGRLSGITLLNPAALKLGDRYKLPGDLSILPYESKFMAITERVWDEMGAHERANLTEELKGKIEWYSSLLEDKRMQTVKDGSPVWKPLAVGGSADDDVCLLPLHMLL